MPISFTPEVKRILRENDCWLVRKGKGDHEIWASPKSEINFTVDGKILSRHTANKVMKDAGLSHRF